MEQQTVSIKRTGTGVHDWELSLSDGSQMPPIKSLNIDVIAGRMPSLVLEVENAFLFDGAALPALWKVSDATLGAMAADQGYDLTRTGLLDETAKAVEELRLRFANLAAEHLACAQELAAERANVKALSVMNDQSCEEVVRLRQENATLTQRCEQAAQRYERDGKVMGALNDKVGEFRENNIKLKRQVESLSDALTQHTAEDKAERNALLFANAILTASRDRALRSADLARSIVANKDWHAPADLIANSPEVARLTAEVRQLRAQVDAGKIDQQRALDAEAIARRYEEENHALKRELKGLPPLKGAPVVADLPDAPPPPSILVLAHDDEQCRRLRNASKGRYKVMSVGQSLYGHRYNTIIVAEVPDYLARLQGAYADRRRNVLSRVLIEDLPCRLNIGGVLINLND